MSHWKFHSFELTCPVLHKTDSQLLFGAVTEMNECPNSFDIVVRDGLEYVRVFGFVIM